MPGHSAVSEAGDLRKDEPDPVAALAPSTQLTEDGLVVAVLLGDEAVQVVRHCAASAAPRSVAAGPPGSPAERRSPRARPPSPTGDRRRPTVGSGSDASRTALRPWPSGGGPRRRRGHRARW